MAGTVGDGPRAWEDTLACMMYVQFKLEYFDRNHVRSDDDCAAVPPTWRPTSIGVVISRTKIFSSKRRARGNLGAPPDTVDSNQQQCLLSPALAELQLEL